MVNSKIRKYISEHREEILRDYFDILKIPSVSGTDKCTDAMQFVKSLYERNGFKAEMYEDYLLSYYKNGGRSVGLFAHADVVPVDDKWTVTSPFEPKIVDGELFARGPRMIRALLLFLFTH